MLILPILIFLTITLGLLGLYVWLTPTLAQQRVQALTQADAKPQWKETVVKLAGPLARLSTPEGNWEESALRLKFLNAGIRRGDARLLYFGAKTVLPLLLVAGAYLTTRSLSQASGLTLLMYLSSAALAGCYVPNAVLHWKVATRRREVLENFPDATDLILVCMEAGLGLDAALTRVAEEIRWTSPALADELHLSNLEMRAGASREKVMHNLALRTGVEEVSTFAIMLKQADKFGTSIGESLRVYSDDLRHKRLTRAEERAAKVPTKMLLPLVLCIFPAVIMVVLGPAIIQVIRTLLPMLGGQG